MPGKPPAIPLPTPPRSMPAFPFFAAQDRPQPSKTSNHPNRHSRQLTDPTKREIPKTRQNHHKSHRTGGGNHRGETFRKGSKEGGGLILTPSRWPQPSKRMLPMRPLLPVLLPDPVSLLELLPKLRVRLPQLIRRELRQPHRSRRLIAILAISDAHQKSTSLPLVHAGSYPKN